VTISVQFLEGLEEEITEVSLRKRGNTRIVVLIFERMQAMEQLRSFTKGTDSLWLEDEEGQMQVFPSGIKFFFRNDDDLARVECAFEVTAEPIWERVMRFLERWAKTKGFEFGER